MVEIKIAVFSSIWAGTAPVKEFSQKQKQKQVLHNSSTTYNIKLPEQKKKTAEH